MEIDRFRSIDWPQGRVTIYQIERGFATRNAHCARPYVLRKAVASAEIRRRSNPTRRYVPIKWNYACTLSIRVSAAAERNVSFRRRRVSRMWIYAFVPVEHLSVIELVPALGFPPLSFSLSFSFSLHFRSHFSTFKRRKRSFAIRGYREHETCDDPRRSRDRTSLRLSTSGESHGVASRGFYANRSSGRVVTEKIDF